MAVHLKFELRPRLKEDGTQPVLLRMTLGKKIARFTLGIYVLGKHWNKNANPAQENWISKKADDWAIVTPRLRNKLRQAEAALMQLEKDGKALDFDVAKQYVEAALQGKSGKQEGGFLFFFKQQIEHIRVAQSQATAVKYTTIYNEISDFLQGSDIKIQDLTLELIHRLEAHWLGKNKRNTVNKKLEQLKAMVSRAIDYGLLEGTKNPFLRYTFKWDKVHKERLTAVEVERIKALDYQSQDRRHDARSVLLFQYYCAGMRVGDAICLRWGNVQGDRLLYRMGKTGTTKSIKLPSQAQAILAQYRKADAKAADFIFPFMRPGLDPEWIEKNRKTATGPSIATINKLLKRVAQDAGIEKNLTTHMARHSFTDHAIKATGDVYAVSRALGHSNITITEAYLARLDEGAVDDTLDTLFGEKKKPDQGPGSLPKKTTRKR